MSHGALKHLSELNRRTIGTNADSVYHQVAGKDSWRLEPVIPRGGCWCTARIFSKQPTARWQVAQH
jgi:hypothetical protein